MDLLAIKKFLLDIKSIPGKRQCERNVDYTGNFCILNSKEEIKSYFSTKKISRLGLGKKDTSCEVRTYVLLKSGLSLSKKEINIVISTYMMESKDIAEDAYKYFFESLGCFEIECAVVEIYSIKCYEQRFISSWIFIMDY